MCFDCRSFAGRAGKTEVALKIDDALPVSVVRLWPAGNIPVLF